MRPVVIKKRGHYRKDPLSILIDAEEGAERLSEVRLSNQSQEERALWEAFHAFAKAHGVEEAKGWCAARAHYSPSRKTVSEDRRKAAEALFRRRAA